MIDKNKMVFFNICWMQEYKGNWGNDIPVNGGKFVRDEHWGGEVYNFMPFNGRMYGYVEPGLVAKKGRQRHLNISRLTHTRHSVLQSSVGGVLVVWVATPKNGDNPLVVGWYENATVYREALVPPTESNRILPKHNNPGEYFALAEEHDCVLLPFDERICTIPGKGKGLGHSNIWYAQTDIGKETKEKVIEFITEWKAAH